MKKIAPRSKGPILVTGAAGFIGSHLVDALQLTSPFDRIVPVVHRFNTSTSHARPCDLTNPAAVKKLLSSVRPALIVHAAGRTQGSYRTLMTDNLLTTANLLHAISDLRLRARLVVLGSAAEYGDPQNPYTWTKCCQTLLAQQKAADGHDVVIARIFNLIGPRLPAAFAAGNMARQIVQSERGELRRMKVGSLTAKRDFIDIRDAARAVVLTARRARRGEVVEICSGRGRPVRDLLKALLRETPRPPNVQQGIPPARSREVTVSVGNSKRLRSWGWKPLISFQDSIRDTLNDYRFHS